MVGFRKLKIDIKGAYLWIEKYEEKKKLDIISDDKIGDKEAAIRNAIDTTEDFKYLVWALNFKNTGILLVVKDTDFIIQFVILK